MRVAMASLAGLLLVLAGVVLWVSLTAFATTGADLPLKASSTHSTGGVTHPAILLSASLPASPSATASPTASAASPSATASPTASAAPATHPDAADADHAMDAFNDAFYMASAAGGRYRVKQGSAKVAVFWRSAELLEMAEDAAQSSHKAAYRRMIPALEQGFLSRFGRSWQWRRYNDDIMWMVIASVRAYDISGRRAYLDLARRNFDATYARAWSGDFGGGLWWTTDRQEKNACVNAPGSIAASLLYERTHNAAYLTRAKRLYSWVRSHLYEADKGRVNDHVSRAPSGVAVVDRGVYTYNQGTFLGAADLLHGITGKAAYLTDARRAIDFARSSLTDDGVLRDEGAAADGGGFKGIFARYAVRFTRRHRIGDYDDWFRQNAQAAWTSRNGAGLIGHDWTSPTGGASLAAFDCSSAVVLLQLTAPR
jgi:predicted alpha-1,6-mannanase (GH76 family)